MTSRRPGPPDPYGVLGVDASADADELHAAYRRRAQELHPDLHPDDPAAGEAMRALNEAWAVLGDPDRRARHDRLLAGGSANDGTWPDDVRPDDAVREHGDDDEVWPVPRRGIPLTAIVLLVLFVLFVVTAYAGPH